MIALSVKQPWASLIASGRKQIETRVWSTPYRGPLLICAGQSPDIGAMRRFGVVPAGWAHTFEIDAHVKLKHTAFQAVKVEKAEKE